MQEPKRNKITPLEMGVIASMVIVILVIFNEINNANHPHWLPW